MIEPCRPNEDRRAYDLEWCAFFLHEMASEHGVDVLLHSRVIGIEAEDGAVRSLSVSTAAGLMKVATRFVIDGSGTCVVPVLRDFPWCTRVRTGSSR